MKPDFASFAPRNRNQQSIELAHSGSRHKRDTGYLFIPKAWRKSAFLVWLRRTHAWLGLWGAILGLLFGLTGFVLNHRQILKIPAAESVESHRSLPVPLAARQNPTHFESWLRGQTAMAEAQARTQMHPAGVAPWGNGEILQPPHWKLTLTALSRTVNAEYWQGNTHSEIKQRDGNVWATLNRLHMGGGMGAAWILLADSLALGLIVLTISGLLLWSRLHGPRLLALGLIGGCLAGAISLAAMSL